MPTTHPLGDS